MNFDAEYVEQVDLLLDALPVLNKFDCFALKGGTAINLFIRDMPRLSVDIDLAYLPIEPRKNFLANLTSKLIEMQSLIENLNIIVKPSYTKDQQLSKLFLYRNDVVIKIEPNFVTRGSVYTCEEHDLCQRAQSQFLKFSRVKTLSLADLYGSKICAALDRQHPRDLFDIKLLFDNQGFTEDIRKAFIVYLISSSRPIHELLNPKLNIDAFEKIFKNEFNGMTEGSTTSAQELIRISSQLIKTILQTLTPDEKNFLILLKNGTPNWSLIGLPNIENLPAVLWKLENIKRIPDNKKIVYQDNLKRILEL